MNRHRLLLALLACLPALAWAGPPLLDPNQTEFPDSSLLDYSERARVDDGHRGFLRVDGEGHFVWGDGHRARFWGINVASESVFQPTERIDTCIDRIRRAGFNLVRLHHVDGAGRGILVEGTATPTFNADNLKTLDYWIYKLGRAGIRVYLDLLDYRSFQQVEGVREAERLGRAAKPYALFDPVLIDQQKRYAKALLREHVNPFTHLAYADDPTMVMLELFDENGLFIKRASWREMIEPYQGELTARWNSFLLQQYGSTARLAEAWAASGDPTPLLPTESLELGTVRLSAPSLQPDQVMLEPEHRLQRARSSDAARFAYQIHAQYYRTMRSFLRDEVGVKVPLTAVGDFDIVPDLLSVSTELDFVGTNFYWDHPVFRSGYAWQKPYFFHYKNPISGLDESAVGPSFALARISGKPLVVREWNHCFPNPFRGSGMVEATAYSLLQDVDAMILFTYGTEETARQVGFFDVHQDPARWGLAAVMGEIYRSAGISPAHRQIDIGYSAVDTFLFKDYHSPLRNLGWVSRVGTRCFNDDLACEADLTIASGRSAAGRYRGGPLLLSRHDSAADTQGTNVFDTPDLLGYPLALRQGPAGTYWFDGAILFPRGMRARAPGGRFGLAEVDALGLRPIGLGVTDTIGFRDDARKVFGFGPLNGTEQLRAALDILQLLYREGDGAAAEARDRYTSDTGELVRDAPAGRLLISAPRVAAVAGYLGGGPWDLGPIRIETDTPRGVAVIVSLDGKPLNECRYFVAKFVTNAINTAMMITPPRTGNNPRDLYQLDGAGNTPVRTNGQPSPGGWRVYRGDQLWFRIGLREGTAEVARTADGWRWFCDTPGVTISAPGAEAATGVKPDGTLVALPPGEDITYPYDVAMVAAR